MSDAASLGGRRAGMGFIHDDEIRAGAQEIVSAGIGFYEIHRDDGERMHIEDGLVGAQVFFEPARRARKHQLDGEVEFAREFLLPLFGEVRRTQHAKPGNLAAVEHLPRDQTSLDRFADAHVVRDEKGRSLPQPVETL